MHLPILKFRWKSAIDLLLPSQDMSISKFDFVALVTRAAPSILKTLKSNWLQVVLMLAFQFWTPGRNSRAIHSAETAEARNCVFLFFATVNSRSSYSWSPSLCSPHPFDGPILVDLCTSGAQAFSSNTRKSCYSKFRSFWTLSIRISLFRYQVVLKIVRIYPDQWIFP